MTVTHTKTKPSAKVQKLFDSVAIPATRVTTQKIVRPKKGTYYSKNLRILTPDIQDPFKNLEPTLQKAQNANKKNRLTFQPSFSIVGMAALILAVVIGFLFIRNISLKKETQEILKEYQAVDRQHYLLREEAGQYERRAGELENLNQYLLQKVSEQERDLRNLSFTLTEQVLELKRQMKAEQEVLLEKQGTVITDKYDTMLMENKKAFHEYFFESYEKNKDAEGKAKKSSKRFLLRRLFS